MSDAPTHGPVLADAVDATLRSGLLHFAPPGHKRRIDLGDGSEDLSRDITLLTGVDGQSLGRGLLRSAEADVARVWGSDWARISVQGSTHGNLSLMLALAQPGAEVIIPRNAHRSTFGGLVLCGARPLWVEPDTDPDSGLVLGVRPDVVRRAAGRSERLAGIVVVDPSYVGVGSDLAAIREIADDHGVPLIVDAAWGAHFGFHPDLPSTAMRAGAHAAVFSLHKTLPALTPASILVASRGRPLDEERLAGAFDLLATTSPSAAVQASADRARHLLEHRGSTLLGNALAVAATGRSRLSDIPGVRCVGEEIHGHASVTRWDPLKLVIDVSATGRNGFDVAEHMRHRRVQVAFADDRRLVALLTLADDAATVEGLAIALEEALASAAHATTPSAEAVRGPVPAMVRTPREAWLGVHERIDLQDAAGRIAAEPVIPYPPGIAKVVPGERLEPALLEELREMVRGRRVRLTGCADPELRTIGVLRNADAAVDISDGVRR